MTSSDNLFFEEFKRLDKLCADAYACKNGVSEYISVMETKTRRQQLLVSTWDDDYRMLMRVRRVRNQIAHDPDAFQISEESDLSFVRDFCSRMFSGQDPLSQLRKAEKAKQTAASTQKQKVAPEKRQKPRTEYARSAAGQRPLQKKSTSGTAAPLIAALAVLALLAAIIYFVFWIRFV